MKAIALRNLGRLGNLMFRYAYARAITEQKGLELRTDPWVGEQIFTLDGAAHKRPDGTEELEIDGYCQNQESLIYSRADCRRWFELRPEIKAKLSHFHVYNLPYGHFRRGDYVGSSGYPLISRKSVENAMMQYGIYDPLIPISDEHPSVNPYFDRELEFFMDFYCLMKAPILFRGNSSFSFWAGVLSTGRVFSPVITGLAGGVEHDDVPYVEGNWPKLAELPNITDLHLPE